MTLSESVPGKVYTVESTKLNEKVGRRLEALGLIIGTKVEVLNRKKTGTLIFKVRGTRLGVGNEICAGIFVKEGVV